MEQNEGINDILPIDSAWTGTTVTYNDLFGTSTIQSGFDASQVGVFSLVVLILALIFGRKFFKFIPDILFSIFLTNDYSKIKGKQSVALYIFFLICSLIFPALLVKYDFLPAISFENLSAVSNYLFHFACVIGYFVLRKIVLYVTFAVSEMEELGIMIEKITMSFFIVAVLLSLFPLPVIFLFQNINIFIIQIIVVSLCGAIFLFYLFYLLKIIISTQVSHFLCFLYLCTLEILPVAIFVSTMLTI